MVDPYDYDVDGAAQLEGVKAQLLQAFQEGVIPDSNPYTPGLAGWRYGASRLDTKTGGRAPCAKL